MKRTLTVHVGLHKTGTTSLQHFLFLNRDLLAAGGLYRPLSGTVDEPANWGHHLLARSLNAPPPREVWQALRQESRGQRHVVISSEAFSLIRNPKRFQPIVRQFNNWSIQIVCYLRSQDRYLESLYNHHVKAVGEFAGIDEFEQKIAWRLDYLTYIDGLQSIFGADAIVVRPYEAETLIGGDICSDFMATIGYDMPANVKTLKRAANPGLTHEGMALMLAANERYRNAAETLSKKRQQILSDNAAPPHYDHNLLSVEKRQLMRDRFRSANDEIARRFLPGQEVLFQD